MADAGPHENDVARLQAEVQRLRAELEHQRSKARAFFERLEEVQAEFEEFRNQAQRDADQRAEAGKRELLLKMLDVTDSLDRAIEFAGGDEALHEGLSHILRQLRAIVEREGVRRVDAEGHPFKPELHEAVMREVTDEYRDGMVIKELGKGYTLHGKVLRRAKVKVAVNKPPP
ncbi:MAG TPA: nucleotide exchange factor GrpE [Candidatus Thermoplasmatota archaeon]|jgi:molecular chaperone GrpE|nr:nucleotide exchange factor GrpE [Candidatus Thermoplasmatota archaeon]